MKEIDDILDSKQLSGFKAKPDFNSGGKWVKQFEKEFRDYFNVKYAIALNSATAGLHASLIACGIGQGDEVIVTPYSFSASATCVLMVNAKPVFVDIDEDIFCLDPFKIEAKLTPRTKAIIPVHLHGHPACMSEIMAIAEEHNLKVIEDSAQAIGAIYRGQYTGKIGDCGVFSFNQSKPINTGEGGMLITNDDEIARIVRAVRNHGELSDPELGVVGYNYRMCEIEAVVGLKQFRQLDKMNDWRIMLADYLTEGLSEIEGLTPPVTYGGCRHTFYTYAIKFDEGKVGMPRDVFQDRMIKEGIYFGKGYVKPLHLLPVFGGKEGQCLVAERMWKKELTVFDWAKYPITLTNVDRAIETVKKVINA